MSAPEHSVSLGFTGERFPAGTHMCYLYNDDGERLELISKFINSGLQEQEKVSYFVDQLTPGEMCDRLRALGVALPLTMSDPDFSITSALDTYCPDGVFEPEQMLQKLRSAYTTSIEQGYASARLSGEMTWALRGIAGSDRLIEYEALINTIMRDYPSTIICQYDVRRFDGATLFDVLAVHPIMIIRGQVVRNPYYVEPEVFLANRPACCMR